MKIILIGNGAWGSAIGELLRKNNKEFSFWEENTVISDGSIIIGALPTQVIRSILDVNPDVKNIIYINCAKGIERETHKLPYQIVTDILGENIDYFTLIGPSFSDEVKQKMPTLVNLGYRNIAHAEEVENLFQTDYFRIRLTKGIRSLELAGAFKNIYAIACGVTDGLGFGMNTRIKVMVLAMEEFESLRQKLRYGIDDNALPATVGDLILTCSSEESRNFMFGKLLVNNSVEEDLRLAPGTVEGYYTAESVPYFEKTLGISLPLAHFVYEITHEASGDIGKKFKEFVKKI